tara:strand:+ start:3762 stop:4832 length:1071 start_codon:yes stop_codon:yes gene_type:complete
MLTTKFEFSFLIIAILLIIYILYKLKYKQRVLINSFDSKITEDFTVDTGAIKEFEKVAAKYNNFSNIQNIQDKFANMPLHEYCIKSSYNSASSGKYVSTSMVQHVLKRGCRFLDFEVFYTKDGNSFIPKIGMSTDRNFIVLDSKNSITLDEVLETIASHAFSQTSPNSNDPIFINLRIKSRDTNVYKAVAKSIDGNLKSVAYTGNISKDTKLSDIMRKVVIVIDKTIQRDYKDYAACGTSTNCYDISNYTNLESGSEYLNLYHYTDLLNHTNTPVLIKDDNIRTTAENMKMVVPDAIPNTSNPAVKEFIVKHGCQNIFMNFSRVDTNLNNYEDFYNDVNGGIIPLSVALPYFVKDN